MKDLIITEPFKKPEYYHTTVLPIKKGKDFLLLRLYDITYLKGDGAYSKIYIQKNGIENLHYHHTCKALGFHEKTLPIYSFLRVHNSFIVNLDKIVYIRTKGGWVLELVDSTIIKVADSHKMELLKRLGLKPEL